MASRYLLRGMVMAAEPLASTNDEYVDLLVILDYDAAQAASDELGKVRRMYEMEVRKSGREMVWFKAVEALQMPRVDPNQLLFTLPGIQVYELQQKALKSAI
ncbi:MAG: hypothetical protein QM790_04290 [Nibricoccus sp.]